MHTRSDETQLIIPLSEPERTFNLRRRCNRRVPIERRDERPENPRIHYPPVDDVSQYHFLINLIKIHDPMSNNDDEPMWVADRNVAPTPDSAITLPETANEFAIKDFIILEMEEDSKVPLILGRPFLHTADAVIRVKQKQLNVGVGNEGMIFSIDSAMKHSYSNDDTCFSIDVIDKIVEADFIELLNEDSNIFYSIKGTPLEEELFAKFDAFMAINTDIPPLNFRKKKKKKFLSKKSQSKQITKSRNLLKNLLQILNSNLFLIT
ncbi:hypothetical protein Tco_0741299 [Tanacetum coccineum]